MSRQINHSNTYIRLIQRNTEKLKQITRNNNQIKVICENAENIDKTLILKYKEFVDSEKTQQSIDSFLIEQNDFLDKHKHFFSHLNIN